METLLLHNFHQIKVFIYRDQGEYERGEVGENSQKIHNIHRSFDKPVYSKCKMGHQPIVSTYFTYFDLCGAAMNLVEMS